jgi:TatD-related deoxyribonuclease
MDPTPERPAAGPPVLDNHVHLDPRGPCLAAVRDFARAGGTHLVVVNKPYDDIRVASLDDFRREFARTVELVRRARDGTGVGTFAAVGPYPVTLLHLAERLPLADAEAMMCAAMDEAARLVEAGDAIAIGEVGRPHFPAPPEAMAASDRILQHAMARAKDVGCAVVVHGEGATEATWRDLACMADAAGLPRGRVVKHFSGPTVDEAENLGIFPSVLASSKHAPALRGSTRYFLETDYLDEPERPGAVLGIRTVPRRVAEMRASGDLTEEGAWAISAGNFERVYGRELDG